MAAVMHHSVHFPASLAPAARRLEAVLEAVLVTLFAPVAFAVLIVSALLLALGLARIM